MLSGLAMLWMLSYLGLGFIQHHRAEAAGLVLAESRGHTPENIGAKPGFANLLLWKSVYENNHYYHVDGVRAGLETTAWPGECLERFNLEKHAPWVDANSLQAKDIALFSRFSNGYLVPWGTPQDSAADIRYSMLPHKIDPIWGIQISSDRNSQVHVKYWVNRPSITARNATVLFRLLVGKLPVVQPESACLSE